KWYSKHTALVKYQYSGTHHRKVKGIDVVSLLWTKHSIPEKAEHIAIDFRVYSPVYDGCDKNDHAHDMLESAFYRGFENVTVLMDGWYSKTKTLRLIDSFKWKFIAAIRSNRQVKINPD